MDAGEAESLAAAHALQTRVQQVARVAQEGPLDPARAGPGFLAALCRATECEDLAELTERLTRAQAGAAALVEARLGAPEAGA